MEKFAYKYCPKCSGNLSKKDQTSYICQKCNYNLFRNSKPTIGIILVDENNKILLGKRKTGESLDGLWGIPGGYLENGEDPIVALKREVKEEIGVEVLVEELLNIEIENDPYDALEETFDLDLTFKGKIISGNPTPLSETEEIRWFSKDEIDYSKIAFEGVKKAIKRFYKLEDSLLPQ